MNIGTMPFLLYWPFSCLNRLWPCFNRRQSVELLQSSVRHVQHVYVYRIQKRMVIWQLLGARRKHNQHMKAQKSTRSVH